MHFKCLLNNQGVMFECNQIHPNKDRYRIIYMDIKEGNCVSFIGTLEECNSKIKDFGITISDD